ncbi:MAG: hypothetical protein M3Q30_13045, partial [Actinomycetota bacterium]|nr:hypothetical protein [Actinomycetota bacterium]
ATSAGTSGTPSVELRTTAPNSLVFGVGSDVDHALARTLGRNQQLESEWTDHAKGNTFWVQSTNTPSGPTATRVTLGDTAPTSDEWNMAAVEVLAEQATTVRDSNASARPTISEGSSARRDWLLIALGALGALAVGVAVLVRRVRARAASEDS